MIPSLRHLTFGLLCIGNLVRSVEAQTGTEPIILGSYKAHPTRILARYSNVSMRPSVISALQAQKLVVSKRFSLLPGLVVLDSADSKVAIQVAQTIPRAAAEELTNHIEALKASGEFDFVEPDYVRTIETLPTDSAFTNGTLWGLSNAGQGGGKVDADIGAIGAWDLTTGSTNVIVAIVDTGIRYTHDDLRGNMWRNPGESGEGKESNGIDDDGDGYVDDVFGINAINGSGDPMDDNGHGTHVAGTIGATANDGFPHVGVSWNVRLMACKALNDKGGSSTYSAYVSDTVECINFAVTNGARIINASYGDSGFSQTESNAIRMAREHGVLFVAAAGNKSEDSDISPLYPAAHSLGNVLSIAAIDRFDELASFSNYGQASVHLGAPGVDIFSCWMNTDSAYRSESGTSMATPHVVGVAALVAAQYPGIDIAEWRARLIHTATPLTALNGRCVSGGRVNAYRALTATADGNLDLVLGASGGVPLVQGRTAFLQALVSDLLAVTNASVDAEVSDVGHLSLANDGAGNDRKADDELYVTPTFTVPAVTSLVVTCWAAAGKSAVTNTIEFPVVAPPPNDLFADRILITGVSNQVSGSNVYATKEQGEPVHSSPGEGGKSLWWRWVAPSDGSLVVTASGLGNNTALAVYTGSAVTNLTAVANQTEIVPQLSFPVVGGVEYQIAGDGQYGASGTITITLQFGAPPPNDLFVNRILITGVSNQVSGSNVYATEEPGEPNYWGFVAGKSVWWKWIAPSSGQLTVHASGLGSSTMLAVYTGLEVTSLVQVGQAAGTSPTLSALVSPETEYQVVVNGKFGAQGTISLSISFAPPPVFGFDSLAGIRLTNEAVQLRAWAASNLTLILQASTNLITWQNLTTNIIGTNGLLLEDANATNWDSRFYRLKLQP